MKLSEALGLFSMCCVVVVNDKTAALNGNPTDFQAFTSKFTDSTLEVEETDIPSPRADFRQVVRLVSPTEAFKPFCVAVE
jgi:hypothetical protein